MKYFFAITCMLIVQIGLAKTIHNFNLTAPPPPGITSFSPLSGPIGTVVTINGTNFGSLNSVIIGGKPAIIVSNSGSIIKALVMPGATTGSVQVSTVDGNAISTQNISIIQPTYPQTQVGNKLVFSTGSVPLIQGIAIDISDDGQSAVIGPYGAGLGQIAFFKNTGCGWVQDGPNISLGWETPVNSVAINSDGTTAVIGGAGIIGGNLSCVWVFVKNNGVWAQQGPRLLGSNYSTNQPKASAIDISADGNTFVYGDGNDNYNANGQYVGAAWVFNRVNNVWIQQGPKLVGTGYILSIPSGCLQGSYVSISKDATTIAIAGPGDANRGATWIFNKVNNNWVQQGPKLANFGGSVSLSADGNILAIGGATTDGNPSNANSGFVIYNRNSNGNWSLQAGPVLRSNMQFGSSVSLAADGATVVVGGPGLNNSAGNSWIYRNVNGTWSSFGNALIGTDNIGNAQQGFTVALTADARFALAGGPRDNNLYGATWVFGNSSTGFSINPFSDTTRVCGDNSILDAGSGFSSYQWNTGANTQTVIPVASGTYIVTVTNSAGCISSDTTYLSVVKANILNNDTIICRTSSVTLSIDSLFPSRGVCSPSQLPTSLRSGLVGFWPFCGNANDASGFNNHGQVFGATLTNDRFGSPNSAYSFNSVNANYIRCPGSSLFTSNSMTLSFWINITNYNELSELICLGNTTGTFWGASTANRIVSLNYGSGCGNGMMSYPIYTFNPGSWYNVTFVSDRVNRLAKVYVNGQFIGDNPSGVNTGCSTSYLYFGVDIFSLPEYFTGKLDDIFIWNRALSLSEIQQVSSTSTQSFSVLWSTGASTNQITVLPSQSTTYYATVTDGITSCVDSIRVNISTVDTSLIIIDPPQVCTNSGQVRFQAGVASSYQWIRNGVAISGANARFYTATQTGTYRVALVNSIGCRDTSRAISVTLYPQPLTSFTVNPSTQCLVGNQFSFINTSTLTTGTMTYLWHFGNGATSLLQSPTYSYPVAGTYTVKLIATTSTGCKDSTTRAVTVYPTPSGVLNTPSTNLLCEGGVVILTATGGASYQWFLNGGAIAGATNSTHSANQPGIYTVNVTSSNGCTSTATGSITLQLISKPTANFTYSNYCATFPTQFSDQSNVANSGIVNYSWNFGQGQGTSTLQNPSYTYPTTGTFSISLMVTPVACPSLSSNVTKPITIVTPPANQRYTTLNAVQNRDLQLEARAFGAAVYSWSPTSGLNNAAVFNPVFNFNTQVEYLITITTPIGCVIKDTQLVRIYKEKGIYVPKGFSPNGDGSNDKIFPRLVGIRTLLYFKIYDRWGQLIYQTSNENEGWDGRYRGAKQPIDTYVWMAEGIDIDNNNLKRTGTFLLLR